MAPVQHPDVGKRLGGKYELVALAGEGGMAEVFRAITHGAAGFRRSVAVKQILEHLSEDPQFVAMFVEEARVTATMTHPNIVQIYEVYEDKSYIHLVQVRPAPLPFPSPAFPVILTNSPPSPVPLERAT